MIKTPSVLDSMTTGTMTPPLSKRVQRNDRPEHMYSCTMDEILNWAVDHPVAMRALVDGKAEVTRITHHVQTPSGSAMPVWSKLDDCN